MVWVYVWIVLKGLPLRHRKASNFESEFLCFLLYCSCFRWNPVLLWHLASIKKTKSKIKQSTCGMFESPQPQTASYFTPLDVHRVTKPRIPSLGGIFSWSFNAHHSTRPAENELLFFLLFFLVIQSQTHTKTTSLSHFWPPKKNGNPKRHESQVESFPLQTHNNSPLEISCDSFLSAKIHMFKHKQKLRRWSFIVVTKNRK